MSKKPKIHDLTPDQKKLICNGCGSESFRPFHFEKIHDLCLIHDLEFAQGGFIWAFFWSNFKLSMRIIKLSYSHEPLWQFPYWMLIAFIYFLVLSISLTYTFSYAYPFQYHSLDKIVDRANKREAGINPRASLNEWVQYWTGKWSKIN